MAAIAALSTSKPFLYLSMKVSKPAASSGSGLTTLPESPGKTDLKKFDQREYDDLKAAHSALDSAVEAAYGVNFDGDEEKIVAHLFKLYAQMTEEG